MVVCEHIADCHEAKVTPDAGALDFLNNVLKKISEGQSPDTAFGWKQARKGRRNQNSAYQKWDIKLTVQEQMKLGKSWRAACAAVSSDRDGEFLLSQKAIEKICEGLTADEKLGEPEDIFPLVSPHNKHRRKP